MTGWRSRVRPLPSSELQQVRAAAQDLAQQAGHAPGKARLVFETVADCALIGTALISGALASVHLYKALLPKPHEDRHGASLHPAGAGGEPPRRRAPAVAAGDASGQGRSRGG